MWRTLIVGDVVARPRWNGQDVTILMFDSHLPCDDKSQVIFAAPMIANIRTAVLDHAELCVSKLANTH
jgi:hypothetical protein